MSLGILMFTPQFRPLVGGAERQVEKLSRSLVRKGVRVRVLTPRIVTNTPLEEIDEGVEIRRFPLLDLSRFAPGIRGLGLFNWPLLQVQTERAIARNVRGMDLVHVHNATLLSLFAGRAATKLGLPSICKAASSGVGADFDSLRRVAGWRRSIALEAANIFNRWIATSGAVREYLISNNVAAERIRLIPNGVDVPTPGPRHDRVRRFLYLGRLSTNSGRDLSTVVKAFDCLAADIADVELALVGGGDLFGETESLVASMAARHRIWLPGEQPPKIWLDWADAFLLPSRREGLSNALLEAMAQGLPCIANDIPANREVLDDGSAGVLTPVGDLAALTRNMRRLVDQPSFAHALGCAALLRVQQEYEIDSVTERIKTLYEEVLSQRNLRYDPAC